MKLKKTYTEKVCFCQYDGQVQPQPAFLQLNLETGELSADYSGEIGCAVPSAVWHNRVLRLHFTPTLKKHAINNLMDEIADLCQTILDNSSVDWDGSNYVGELNDAGQAAYEAAEFLVSEYGDYETDCLRITSLADWYQYDPSELVESALKIGVAATCEKFESDTSEVDIWEDNSESWLEDLMTTEVEKLQERLADVLKNSDADANLIGIAAEFLSFADRNRECELRAKIEAVAVPAWDGEREDNNMNIYTYAEYLSIVAVFVAWPDAGYEIPMS